MILGQPIEISVDKQKLAAACKEDGIVEPPIVELSSSETEFFVGTTKLWQCGCYHASTNTIVLYVNQVRKITENTHHYNEVIHATFLHEYRHFLQQTRRWIMTSSWVASCLLNWREWIFPVALIVGVVLWIRPLFSAIPSRLYAVALGFFGAIVVLGSPDHRYYYHPAELDARRFAYKNRFNPRYKNIINVTQQFK